MRSQQICQLYKDLTFTTDAFDRSIPCGERVTISQPSNRGLIMAELRQKIYSKKRMKMANVISGMATGGLQDTFGRLPAVF